MSLLDDLRVDIGDDSSPSGAVSSGVGSCLVSDLRLDYGDDGQGGVSLPGGPEFVVCPPTSTDNSVARWNGTDGCGLQDSLAIIDDNGNITTPGGGVFGGNVCLGGSLNLNRRIITSGNIQMLASDGIVFVNKIVGAPTLATLPLTPKIGMTIIVKDMKGDADINFITVQMSSGTIDGLPQFVMSNDYQSMTFAFNGTEWNII